MLNLYLILNVVVVLYILYRAYAGREPRRGSWCRWCSSPSRSPVGIHTVTAFLYNGMAARPYWNASILAPRFLASAFCSGPAVMIILFQILRKTTEIAIKDEAIWKVAELMAYAMFFNLFLLGAELFKEFYSRTEHLLVHAVPLVRHRGPPGARAVRLVLALRQRRGLLHLPGAEDCGRTGLTLNVGCLLIWSGVYIEKGMGLVIPGMTPDTLGEIYEYRPTLTEWSIALGIFGVGFMVFTILVKISVPILVGTFKTTGAAPASH